MLNPFPIGFPSWLKLGKVKSPFPVTQMAIFKRSLPQKQPKNPEQQGTNETLGKTTNGGEASTIQS